MPSSKFVFGEGGIIIQSTGVGIFTPSSSKPMIPMFSIGMFTSGNMMVGSFVPSSQFGGTLLLVVLVNLCQVLCLEGHPTIKVPFPFGG